MAYKPPQPRYQTPRTSTRPTFGPAVADLSARLGRVLLPWQRTVLDVALEVDVSRETFAYPLVVVSTQRQSGKSTAMLTKKTHKAIARPDRRLWLTAQTGKDARDLWADHVRFLDSTPLAAAYTKLTSNGHERLTFRNGSTIAPHPPTERSLHGKQSDDNDIDEGWVFDAIAGQSVMQAIVPTQATRPGAQTWVWSTQGHDGSEFFNDLCDRGRAGDPDICYLEWSVPPSADPTDLEVIAAHHPAFGYLLDADSLRRARAQLPDDNEWARAFGNLRTRGSASVIDAGQWAAITAHPDTVLANHDGPAGWSVDVSPDRDYATIAVCRLSPAGRPVAKVIDHRPGESWAAARLLELIAATPRRAVAIDAGGPAGSVADELRRAGVDLVPMPGRDLAAACGGLWRDIREGTITLVSNVDLDAARESCVRRPAADSWVWARRIDGAPVSPLWAVTLARWAVDRAPKPSPAPVMVV